MKYSRLLLCALAAGGLTLAPAEAKDQSGAETKKKPVAAKILVPKGTPKDGEQIGDVQVRYEDGTTDTWTTKGNTGLARVAEDGTVGWVVFEPEKQAPTASYKVRLHPTIVFCEHGKVTGHLTAGKPFIEKWEFSPGGKTIAIASMSYHGPELYELVERASGKVLESASSAEGKTPKWAKRIAVED